MEEYKPLTVDEYVKQRNISDEALEEARLLTEQYVHDYELKEARRRSKLTQIQIALRMNVSQKRISELESKDISKLKVDTLRRYVESLGGTLRITAELPDGTIPLYG